MKIYVSNLGFSVQDEDLSKLFGEYGSVFSAKVIMDKFTGKSRGFAFVEITDQKAAEMAIRELDGKMVDSRPIQVSEARANENQSRSSSTAKRW